MSRSSKATRKPEFSRIIAQLNNYVHLTTNMHKPREKKSVHEVTGHKLFLKLPLFEGINLAFIIFRPKYYKFMNQVLNIAFHF